MSPHALPLRRHSSFKDGMNGISNGVNGVHLVDVASGSNRSYLQPTDNDQLHDLIGVGFGPASLAIAIALHDELEKQEQLIGVPELAVSSPKVAFLEKQSGFAWHAGMLLEGAKMQISFVKDMATLRNPRSSFTFLNYLHEKDRLVQFTNLDTFLPQRIEFEDYLKWCADWFEDVAHYSQEVLEIRPEKSHKDHHTIDSFTVLSRDTQTQEITTRRARHVVIAVGGRPVIPQPFPQRHPRLLHSSQYSYQIPQVLRDRQASYKIAVVGGGQSAAEIFNSLHSQYPNAQTRLIIKCGALKPSDDSPFVNEIFDPIRVDGFYSQPVEARSMLVAENRYTNYGVVRLELLEHIYQTLYMQRIHNANEEKWQHRILANTTVVNVDYSKSDKLRLHLARSETKDAHSDNEDFDAVILGTGYLRDTHEALLAPARYLLPGGDKPGKKWGVSRDYKVQFEEGAVSEGAGVYLQGCNEQTHGLADTLLSILAVRGGEIVQSIFGTG